MSSHRGSLAPKVSDEGPDRRHKSLINVLLNSHNLNLFNNNETLPTFRRDVHMLDDHYVTIEFNSKTLGRQLLCELCTHLGVLNSSSYFGIRYVDNNNFMQWLNLDEKVLKQIKDLKEQMLCLRIMFYPPNPLNEFKDTKSKHLFYLQLRRDLYVGHLRTNCTATCELAAYAIQAEHGLASIPEGFDVVHIPGGMRVLTSMPKEIVLHIQRQLKSLLSLPKSEAKDEFIRRASEVETYGMEPFQVMDQFENGLCIGMNYVGLSAFKSGYRTDIFPWTIIQQIKQVKKQLVIVVSRNKGDVRLGFKCHSTAEAKMLLKRATSCARFSRQIGRMRLVGPELCAPFAQNGDESTATSHCVVTPKTMTDNSSEASSEVSSSASQSDEEQDFPNALLSNQKRKEASQPALHRLHQVPRYSIATPAANREIASTEHLQIPRKSLGGSMDLSAEAVEGSLARLKPQSPAVLVPAEKRYIFTSSSINLPSEDF
ncbi:unnamed protein product [Dicrocoelium dendriticum]|nr:unnamed protein product [Dicrocoelium dendriticum]CAH8455618.1 unnamed protein product [Dicrocoelium dendriticum]